jgi:Tol biopolymer transport system component/predicted Ser/Thr protein kinase
MLSREERILSELLLSRGLVTRDRLEACARQREASPGTASLAEFLVDGGALDAQDARKAAEEARALEASLAPDLPGESRLGEFLLVREIGRGGMGIVYEAEQEPLGRRVALKVLPAGAALDERLSIRFLKEARAAARLDHPGIVQVFTSGRDQGVLYFAMELIEGRSLADIVAGGPMAPDEAARIAAQVARALDHAHRSGLIHRDVKPENILLGPDGRPRITDFGLVHDVSAATFTLSHHVLGTPAFIAPEQAIGEPVDPRSDVYGLGAVLYNLLTGRAPYAGELPSVVLGRVLTAGPTPLLSLSPDLPPALVAICERAMTRKREDRYPTALAMAVDLEAYLGIEGSAEDVAAERARTSDLNLGAYAPARRSGDTPQEVRAAAALTPKEARASALTPGEARAAAAPTPLESAAAPAPPAHPRRGVVRALAFAVTVTAAVLVLRALAPSIRGGGTGRGGAATTAPAASPGAPLESPFTLLGLFPGRRDAPRLSPDGRSLAYSTRERGHWDVFVRAVPGGETVDLTGDSTRDETMPVFSPDGRSLAFSTGARGGSVTIEVMELATRRRRSLTTFGEDPDWSPDGREIVVISGTRGPGGRGTLSHLWKIDALSGESQLLNGIDASSPSWSPSGSRIAFTSRSGGQVDIWTIAAAGGEATRLTNDAFADWSPVWSSEGDFVYFGSEREGSYGIWRVALAQSSGRPTGAPERVTSAALAEPLLLSRSSRDGRIVLAATYPVSHLHRLRFDPDAGTVEGSPIAFPRRYMGAGSPDVSSDGRLLVYAAKTPQEDIAVQTTDGSSEPSLITQDTSHDHAPRWSRDGMRIAFESDRGGAREIWTARADGSDARRLLAMPDAKRDLQPVWSPDGKRLAVGAVLFDVRDAGTSAAPRAEALPPFVEARAGKGGRPLDFEAWSWSPDGAALAGTANGIVLYDVRERSYRRLCNFGERPVWMPDGRRLLFTSDRVLYAVDAEEGRPRAIFAAAPAGIAPGVAIAPDGRTIYLSLLASPDEVWAYTPPKP